MGDTTDTNNTNNQNKKKFTSRSRPSWLEFALVRTMLLALIFLATLLIILPFIIKSDDAVVNEEIIDYSKWVLTALLAAFGAWIGAGAAYFFGKENMIASNKSTQDALKLQAGSVKNNAHVLDIQPTALNPSFQFQLGSTIDSVMKQLENNVDYWFVPVIENGKLIDTVHTEAFWRYRQKNPKDGTVADVIEFIAKEFQQKKTKLHGFYLRVKMDDLVREVSDTMNKEHASVGIVCDKEEKPTHCFSKSDLKSFKLGSG